MTFQMTKAEFDQVSKIELFKTIKSNVLRKLIAALLDWAYREGYNSAMEMIHKKEKNEK